MNLQPKSEFSRNILTLMTGSTIAQAIPIAVSPVLTRIYTPEDFGIFALFVSIVSIFVSISSGRYELAIILPSKDEEAINIFALGFIITTLLSLLLLLLVILFNDIITGLFTNTDIAYWLYFIPVVIFFTGMYNLLSYFNNRKQEYKDMANATIIKSIVLVIVQLGVGMIKAGVAGLISGQVVSSIFANMKLMRNIVKDKVLLSQVSIKSMKALGGKYKDFPKYQAPHALLNSFSSNLPVYLFSSFFNATIIGFYSLSTRIIFIPMMILAGSSAKVYNKKVTQIHEEKGDTYGFTLNLLKSLFKKIILPFSLVILFAPEIFHFVFGPDWIEAGVYTQILSPWLLMVFFVATISFIPSLVNLQKKALVIEILYTILRAGSLGIGIYYHDIYLALILYTAVGFLMLNYNMYWMLNALKKFS